jgi:hypothetical protein|tara:strand:+ start:463 stop:1248 length:786 start_codon:yes stop_codon:yes gene_type:complete
MDYKHQLEIVKELDVQGKLRTDCPFCMNRKTFEVTNQDGVLLWNCFHASCDAKGGSGDKYSKEDIESFISQEKQLHNHKFIMPKTFVNFAIHPKARAYANTYGIENTNARIMYDVEQERVVFLIENNGEVVSAIGKAYGHFQPKWFKYSKSDVPFITGNNTEIAIIVEDCVSACVAEVKCGFTGIALMGTSLQESFIEHITNSASNVVICLDRDATDKCFNIKKKLESKVNCFIWMLDEDLKYFEDSKIKKWKEKICKMIS